MLMRKIVFSLALLAAGFAAAQMPTPAPAAGPEQVDSGPLLNYEEGRNVVLQRPDGTSKVYPVASNLNWPPDMGLSGWVNVYFVPLQGGGFRVTRLTTIPLTPTPPPPPPTEPPALSPPPAPATPSPQPTSAPPRKTVKGPPVKMSIENSVRVKSLNKGRQITVVGKDGAERVYELDDASELPKNLSAGKRVIIETKKVNGRVVVSRIVYPEVVISNVPKSQ